jgi:hypothetical protein
MNDSLVEEMNTMARQLPGEVGPIPSLEERQALAVMLMIVGRLDAIAQQMVYIRERL